MRPDREQAPRTGVAAGAQILAADAACRLDDATLVHRARAGDAWATEALFRRYAHGIIAMCARLLQSREAGEDAAQEAFVTALSDLSTLREPAAFSGWLNRIAVHKVHRRFRRRRLKQVLGLGGGTDDACLEALASPDASPELLAELALVDERLRRLPPKQRMAWSLKYVEGMTLPQVAQALDCSLATVKRWIAKAQAVVDIEIGDRR